MAEFESCADWTLDMEGGTNTSVYDRGGDTKFGISSKTYPNLDILGLTRSDACHRNAN